MKMLAALLAFALLTLPVLLASPASAQTTAVDKNGNVTISGEVSAISRDSFTLNHSDGTGNALVQYGTMTQSSIEQLYETGILQDGSHVTVEGRFSKGPFNRTVIEARNIYVQAPVEPVE